jgi:hypothetical protein
MDKLIEIFEKADKEFDSKYQCSCESDLKWMCSRSDCEKEFNSEYIKKERNKKINKILKGKS